MIKSFKHKGLEQYFLTGSLAGIQANHEKRLRAILQQLDQAKIIQDMNLPSLRLHQLKGDRAGTWSVKVSGNWRVTFRFENGEAEVIDYEDYH